ncbi:DUF3080 family protein [Aliiglaciecola sp. LCG003]|uniref:DUF3080 family protein n=1 Tax=Aliiglaciecola sp. LCG003 TaxID=3053655 RepID=UPI00257265DE|nr:DUF3080 family protein [Aliiglaciecola sp. LCG003]WJG07974.1 DUF3080 family protein [Aliiglaciecola sp. LCG003]
MLPIFKPIAAYLCVSMLGACTTESIDSDLMKYHSRLANILQVDTKQQDRHNTLTYPKASVLAVDIAQTSINLRDFYGLNNCSVMTLIAQRNTPLGKVQLPSSRYIYEVKLIEGITACLASTSSPEQAKLLNQWLVLKQRNLPLVWTNLLQNSIEVKQAFSSNRAWLKMSDQSDLHGVQQALDYLLQLHQSPKANPEHLENALNQLRKAPLLAKMWRTQLLLSNELSHVSALLDENNDKLHCHSAQSKQQVEYMKNVFQMFFIDRVQPLAGQLNQFHYSFEPLISTLIDKPQLSPSLKQYLQARMNDFAHYQQIMSQHIHYWQTLLARCNLSPQRS